MTSRVPVCQCLSCGASISACTKVTGTGAPVASRTIAMCAECGAVAIFGDGLVLRPLTDPEIAAITGSDELMAALRQTSEAVHFAKAARN